MICIPFDWKFSSESNGMHIKVIRGHQGSKRVILGRKWVNAGQIHFPTTRIPKYGQNRHKNDIC